MQTAVIVLAAGAGTRMKSKTPKVLHTLAGRSMLAHSLHAATSLNPTHLVTVVGHDRERVTEAVNAVAGELDRSVTVAVQDEQKGTGHAVSCGLEGLPADFSGTVLVTAADVPLLDGKTIADLLAQHTAAPAAAVTVLTSTAVDPTGYGRILRTTDGEVNAIVEEKEATDSQRSITEVNSGVYAFDFETLRDALASLDSNNAQHEFYLTDVIMIARRAGKRVRAQHIADSVRRGGQRSRAALDARPRDEPSDPREVDACRRHRRRSCEHMDRLRRAHRTGRDAPARSSVDRHDLGGRRRRDRPGYHVGQRESR